MTSNHPIRLAGIFTDYAEPRIEANAERWSMPAVRFAVNEIDLKIEA